MKNITHPVLQAEPIQLKNSLGDIYITITTTDNYIEAKWRGYVTADDVITAATNYLSYLQANPCDKLLNDKSDVTGDWIDANPWLEFEWLPLAVKAGLRCITHVYSSDMFSQLSARDLYLRLSPTLHTKTFTDREQAIIWLLACNTSISPASKPATIWQKPV